ncbi:MarR family winged helix-turn-helix transcriptional regulator [Ruegeria arenilitoris]|uniref:MarR family winged helix-turn-helix transcriptional regulator n=1 Tax=Ruegeria arenilitoris TaxID=1173585 RepID=UPI00147FEB9F|nr:MarR family winged helix-turn-helix transcriptional regulator [Ruegeria arenilitoris]
MSTSVFATEDQRQTFRAVLTLFNVLRDVEKDMPMSMAAIFAWVALNEGGTQVELRQALGMPSSTASRNLAALSKVHRLGKPGHDLIEWVENPEDRRAKLLYLTPKGKALVNELLGAVR